MIDAKAARSDARLGARFRLDVKRPGEPFLPHSFHASHAEAFDAGLVETTGQCTQALPCRPGWDFVIHECCRGC